MSILASLLFATTVSSHGQSCCGSMADFLTDPSFVAMHIPPAPYEGAAHKGHMVTFLKNPLNAKGYYVGPANGVKSAVILVHEWWGLNDYIKEDADKLNAETGYGVLAVDLYDGKIATTAAEAGNYMGAVDENKLRHIVKAAVFALHDSGIDGHTFNKIGTLGYCFGGGWSFNTAVEGGSKVNACVMYYGMPDTTPEAMTALKAPVLMIHAMQDKWINDTVVSGFEKAMKEAGHSLTVLHYNAVHAFANPSNPKYDKISATDARTKALAFLKKRLG